MFAWCMAPQLQESESAEITKKELLAPALKQPVVNTEKLPADEATTSPVRAPVDATASPARTLLEKEPASVEEKPEPVKETITDTPPPALLKKQSTLTELAQKEPPTDGYFQVKVRKNGESLGMDVNTSPDGEVHCVDAVHEGGLIEWYNQSAMEGSKVKPGMYIIAVNKKYGKDLMKPLTSGDQLVITFRRVQEMTFSLSKDPQLGLDLSFAGEDKDYINVTSIQEGGASAYNETAPSSKLLRVPCRIIGVNGFRGNSAEMHERLKNCGSPVELTVTQ